MNLRCVEFALKHITCYSKLWKTHTLVYLPKGQFTPTLHLLLIGLAASVFIVLGRNKNWSP